MNNKLTKIGAPPWGDNDLRNALIEFLEIYKSRPVKDNSGGMKSPHMFAVWFLAKTLSPDLIVESGIWKGQSTWLLEQACPDAQIYSIDLNLDRRIYISKKAIYSDRDFSELDWSEIPSNSLAFFDDHQNALKRLQQCVWCNFSHVIFEDNYPPGIGDCYSLKQAFAGAGHGELPANKKESNWRNKNLGRLLRRLHILPRGIAQYHADNVAPNIHDAKIVQRWIDVYYEFPPVFKADKTRWGFDWNDQTCPTPVPVLNNDERSNFEVFYEDAMYYTWICYLRLKQTNQA
jgi:hypothetical protein